MLWVLVWRMLQGGMVLGLSLVRRFVVDGFERAYASGWVVKLAF